MGSCAAARPASGTCSTPSRRPSSVSARPRNLLATGAQAVPAAANPGCALQIGVHAGLPVHHPMELLAASIHGRKP